MILGFLDIFGSGQTPELNFAGHCDASTNGCTSLSSEISTCQNQHIQVLLSIRGSAGSESLYSTKDANQLASDLWDNFLGGQSKSRPLGDAVLNGIDFDIELVGNNQFWDDLAMALAAHNNGRQRVVLSAARNAPSQMLV